jgi:hypothetical protein
MQYSILQLSDIHLGSNYDGHLDTVGQWHAVLKHAKKNCPHGIDGYDAVVITGDLIDDTVCLDPDNNTKSHNEELSEADKEAQYLEILYQARSLLKPDGILLVTPGNHDNRLALGRAAVNAEVVNANANMFMNPGENLQFGHLGDYTLIAIDSGNGEPYKAIANLAYICHKDKTWDRSRTIIFSHKPFKAANLYHKFMGNNCLDFDVGLHFSRYAARYFCGHWHHYTSSRMTSLDGEFSLTVCPGIQCQIDPYSEKCNAIALPGYIIITCGGSPQVTYEVRFIDNWKDEQTDN